MEDGGYDFKLVEEGDIDLECPICLSLVREAMGTPCTHLLCRSCFIKFQQSSGPKFICPNCKTETDYVNVVPNTFADRLVTRSKVVCQRKDAGCVWEGSINSYFQTHDTECDFKLVNCRNDGCVEQYIRKMIIDHQQNCQHRFVNCIHCNEIMKFSQLEKHHADDCARIPIKCVMKDCLEMLPRNEIEEHLIQVCAFARVECQFRKLGCSETVERRFLQKHYNQFINSHNSLMISRISQSDIKIEQLIMKVNQSEHEINNLQESKVQSLNKIMQMTEMNEQLNTKVNELNSKLNQLEAEIKNPKPKPNREHISNANIKVKTTIAAANAVISIQPNLLDILFENGIKKFIYKEKVTMSRYKEWYIQIHDLMEVNKLYRGTKSLFIKIINEGVCVKNKIYWYSNTNKEQRTIGRNYVYFENKHVALERYDGNIFIYTATYEEGYTVNNGYECYLLHPRDERYIIMEGSLFGSSRWSVNIPRGDNSEYLILCLSKK